MIKTNAMKKYALLFGTIVVFAFSCSKDNEITDNQALTQTELKAILETDDVARIADNVLAEIYNGNGQSAKSAKIADCYVAEYTETGFTATFNNCVLNGTENVNGTLDVVYSTGTGEASFTATFADFYVGNIKINGTRGYTIVSDNAQGSIILTVVSNLVITMADESVITESGTKTFGIDFGDSLETTTYSIDGDWTVKLQGNTYMVTVGSILEGNLACGYLTNGIMTVDKNGLYVTIDFGDGSCDDMATLRYPNDVTEEITLRD
jgi:aryl-phospho-beta-D-glucosidase BglC (GH1 family)